MFKWPMKHGKYSMQVIKYIKEHGLTKLKEEFCISVKEYEDRYVLNYNQIDSPRFHPIVDECRGLIVDKDFNVMCRSFHRFFNMGECAVDNNYFGVTDSHRVFHPLKIKDAKIYHKMDGTLINIYWDYFNNKWQIATRGMAFAEEGWNFIKSFEALAQSAKEYDDIILQLNDWTDMPFAKEFTYMFELTSPWNRVITPYDETHLTLLSVRDNIGGEEQDRKHLELIASKLKVKLPVYYEIDNWMQVSDFVNNFPTLQEGVVLVWESKRQEGHYRLKCKNLNYLAVHNLRPNGLVMPHRILTLIYNNGHEEYLSYFKEDKKYFDFVLEEYEKFLEEIKFWYDSIKDIENQKEFALTMQEKVLNKKLYGFLFSLRNGKTLSECIDAYVQKYNGDCKKMAELMSLTDKFVQNFDIKLP